MRAHVWYRVPRWLMPTLRAMPPFDDMAHCEHPEHDAPIDATRYDVTPVGASAEAASRDALLHLEAACLSVQPSDGETVVWIGSTIDAQGHVAECKELFARAPAEVWRNPVADDAASEVGPEVAAGPEAAAGPAAAAGPEAAVGPEAAAGPEEEVARCLQEALALEERTFELQIQPLPVASPSSVPPPSPSPPPPPPPPEPPRDAEPVQTQTPRTLVLHDGELVLALESHLTPRCLRLLGANRTSWPTAEAGRFVALATSGAAVQIGNALVDAGSYTAEGVDACYEWTGSTRAKRAPAGGPRGRVMRLVREKSRRRERR